MNSIKNLDNFRSAQYAYDHMEHPDYWEPVEDDETETDEDEEIEDG